MLSSTFIYIFDVIGHYDDNIMLLDMIYGLHTFRDI